MGYRSNIVNVDVGSNSEVTIERGIYQYDHGMKLKIVGIETSDTIEVHYAFKGMRDVVIDTPTKDGSAYLSSIPDEVLAQPMPVNAYVY